MPEFRPRRQKTTSWRKPSNKKTKQLQRRRKKAIIYEKLAIERQIAEMENVMKKFAIKYHTAAVACTAKGAACAVAIGHITPKQVIEYAKRGITVSVSKRAM